MARERKKPEGPEEVFAEAYRAYLDTVREGLSKIDVEAIDFTRAGAAGSLSTYYTYYTWHCYLTFHTWYTWHCILTSNSINTINSIHTVSTESSLGE